QWIFYQTPPIHLGGSVEELLGAAPLTAFLTELRSIGRGFWLLLWPRTLCPDYSLNEIPHFAWRLTGFEDWQVLISGAGIAVAVLLMLRLRRERPAASFYLGFLLNALLPPLGMLLLVGGVLAERLLYLPIAGFAGCVVLAAEGIAR